VESGGLSLPVEAASAARRRAFYSRYARRLLVVQLCGTLVFSLFLPTNATKAVVLPCWWLLTFGPLAFSEVLLFIGVSVLFTGMNALALKEGIFRFASPEVLGMPYHETFMWGFYVLHARRMLGLGVRGGSAVLKERKEEKRRGERVADWAEAFLLAVPFAVLHDQTMLFYATTGVLAAALVLFYEKEDLAFVGYMILLGALFEYTGVWSGEWSYPGAPFGGVPPWFATMWGGVGLFCGRLFPR